MHCTDLRISFFCCTFASCMKLSTNTFHLVLLLPVFSLLASCTPDAVCRQENTVALGVSVQYLFTDSAGNSTIQNTFDSISVQGINNDSVLYANAHNLSALWLPLRPDTSLTAFSLLWHGQYDTLYVRHNNTLRFISHACGCAIYHTIDSVWHHGNAIDSIAIINSTVETTQQENIQLTMRKE